MSTPNELKQLVFKRSDLRLQLKSLEEQIAAIPDGFIYVTAKRSFGSIDLKLHNNKYKVAWLCDRYNNDNEIVDVFTNNMSASFNTEGEVYILSIDALIEKLEEYPAFKVGRIIDTIRSSV